MRGVFFGLEYDNDAKPNAIVVSGTRSGKFTKWVNEYNPTMINREDGKKVLRERRCVQCPTGFRLRSDQILGEMNEHKTNSWQDGKFFVVETHAIGVYVHPLKAKMEKAEKERRDADDAKRKSDAEKANGPAVSRVSGPADNPGQPSDAK